MDDTPLFDRNRHSTTSSGLRSFVMNAERSRKFSTRSTTWIGGLLLTVRREPGWILMAFGIALIAEAIVIQS